MSTLVVALIGCAAVAAVCWLSSLVTNECSWVDRLWSITPVGYVVWFAYQTGFSDPRLVVMSALTAAWGARLTFNFARKGGYGRGGEDYRWGVLRTRMKPWQFQIFNLLFIAGYQNLLLLLITLPAYAALDPSGVSLATIGIGSGAAATPAPFGVIDVVATSLLVLFLVGETVADNQQWAFQQAKRARIAAGQPTAVVLQGYNLASGNLAAKVEVVGADGSQHAGGAFELGKASGSGALRVVSGTFKAPSLRPGEYELRVTLTDSAGKTATSTGAFAVTGS